jgi:nucleolar pre-ribosomal-associated protein 1
LSQGELILRKRFPSFDSSLFSTSYWSATALTLEPRLSSKWIANIAFFGSVLALPIPLSAFLLPGSGLFQPSPPPLSILLENILPSVNTKNNMSKGLQSASPLVQHCTALALAKCLVKYADVVDAFHDIQCALEEDEEEGQWCKRRREVEREVRHRVPEFQVIVGYSQHKLNDGAVPITSTGQTNLTKTALLSESAQRLLWLYHRCLPLLVAEARFDVGKLLQIFLEPQFRETAHDLQEGIPSAIIGLRSIRELHVLRLLKESDQFAWSGKSGNILNISH